MSNKPLVSILINNYNYEKFIADAIESAIAQTYANKEIIVVDDGSTDNSRQIITDYENQITPLFKENGGQASAFNAGFSLAKGEIIIFLDSDDLLLPEIVEQVVPIFQEQTETAKVQYRLQVINGEGKPTGEIIPPRGAKMPNGDLKPHLLKFANYAWPPTTGNAFRKTALQEIFPIEENIYRISADRYLNWLSVMFGTVVSLETEGGLYRVHGKNNYRSEELDFSKLKRSLIVASKVHEKRKELFKSLYGIDADKAESRDLLYLINRIIFLKLNPQDYPFEDKLSTLSNDGIRLALDSPGYHWSRKIFLAFWFASMQVAPKSVAETLARKMYFPQKRGKLTSKLLAIARKFG
ncbi:MAG: glycosyltransferase [Oscillatoria sp. PMC 1068.18]|nr:glycosyltransferase [Oscillatoria sp. PMC 1068.18]